MKVGSVSDTGRSHRAPEGSRFCPAAVATSPDYSRCDFGGGFRLVLGVFGVVFAGVGGLMRAGFVGGCVVSVGLPGSGRVRVGCVRFGAACRGWLDGSEVLVDAGD